MINFFKSLYLDQRFYLFIFVIAAFFLLSFWFSILFTMAILMALVLAVLLATDFVLLYGLKQGIEAKRKVAEKLSNGDENNVALFFQNNYAFKIRATAIDEIPFQFQKRDFLEKITLESKEEKTVNYILKPSSRGQYHFGNLNVYIASPLRMVIKRFIFDMGEMTAVYPSYLQMKKYEFIAMSSNLKSLGIKKIRKIGRTMEFEQIRKYVNGDDLRTVNWKATAKKGTFMVNQCQDEKSQSIYSLIDTGRVMKMPFGGLKLLDYAINATLAFSNIALRKNDRVGMFTFSKKVACLVKASNKRANLVKLNEALYRIHTDYSDTDYGLLYATIRRTIPQRSLLILYTNFEHISGLNRQLSYLKLIAKQHALVAVFFRNTELEVFSNQPAKNLQELYVNTIAGKLSYEKKRIVKELQNSGIYPVLTNPEELSVKVINKYLEFKSRGFV